MKRDRSLTLAAPQSMQPGISITKMHFGDPITLDHRSE